MESVEEEKTGARPRGVEAEEAAGLCWRRSEVRSEKSDGKSCERTGPGSAMVSGSLGRLDGGISAPVAGAGARGSGGRGGSGAERGVGFGRIMLRQVGVCINQMPFVSQFCNSNLNPPFEKKTLRLHPNSN